MGTPIRNRISKRSVDRAEPAIERYILWDTDLKGFGLRVSPTGVKTFIARYRVGGGRRGALRQQVIGRYGVLTPDQARDLARGVLADAVRGTDPQAAKAASRAEPTMSELFELYMSEGVATKKDSTLEIDRFRIRNHLVPTLGTYQLSKVSRAHVEKALALIAAGDLPRIEGSRVRGGKGAATRSVGLLGAVFEFAVARGLCRNNPCRGVKRFADTKRERFLASNELKRLGETLAALEGEGVDWRPIAIIRLLALTGARKNEIVRLRWSEVDLLRGMLRLSDSKTGAKVVRVGAPALKILSDLPRLKTIHVFPDPSAASESYRRIDWAWVKVRKRAGLLDVRIHDLRHSFASVGLAAGHGLPLIGKLLGHTAVSTTSRYAHLADDPARMAAEAISASVAGALDGREGQVVSPDWSSRQRV